MKIVGLITEYNPFHNGHLYHLEASKKETGASHAVAVMSGHFLQRGEPAIMDKWTRARNAVEAGVDLVIELPTLFSCSSAEYFAFGAVSLLKDLNAIDFLCFGSEDGQLRDMQNIANLLSSEDDHFDDLLAMALKSGVSYPKAREMALESYLGHQFAFKPNNILGIEYLKAINVLDSPFEPRTIQRIQADYMSTSLEGTIASATAIRLATHTNKAIKAFVPQDTHLALQGHKIYPEQLAQMLLYKIRTMSPEDMAKIHDVSEGLEMRIKAAAEKAWDFPSLMAAIMTKRYTRTRIQRILMKILLNITDEMMGKCYEKKPLYIRVLAFNDKGQEILARIKKNTAIPLVTNINKVHLSPEAQAMLNLDLLATDLYNLLYPEDDQRKAGKDKVQQPYKR